METLSFLPSGTSVLQQLNSSVLSHMPHFNLSQLSHLHFNLNQTNLHFANQGIIYQQLIPVKTVVTAFLDSLSYSQFAALWVALFWISLSLFKKSCPRVADAPYHGYRTWFEPTFLVQARTFFNSRSVIKNGFQKVCCTLQSKRTLTHELLSTKTRHSFSESRPRT